MRLHQHMHMFACSALAPQDCQHLGMANSPAPINITTFDLHF